LTLNSTYSTVTTLQRKRYLFVCINRRGEDNPKGCCAAKDSEEVYKALKQEVAARGLAKLEARVCTSSCLDQCDKGVTVFNRAGRQIDNIPTHENWTGNVCFGGKDKKTLFITASKSLYAIRTRVAGVGSQ